MSKMPVRSCWVVGSRASRYLSKAAQALSTRSHWGARSHHSLSSKSARGCGGIERSQATERLLKYPPVHITERIVCPTTDSAEQRGIWNVWTLTSYVLKGCRIEWILLLSRAVQATFAGHFPKLCPMLNTSRQPSSPRPETQTGSHLPFNPLQLHALTSQRCIYLIMLGNCNICCPHLSFAGAVDGRWRKIATLALWGYSPRRQSWSWGLWELFQNSKYYQNTKTEPLLGVQFWGEWKGRLSWGLVSKYQKRQAGKDNWYKFLFRLIF
jgi:hypothetical protein